MKKIQRKDAVRNIRKRIVSYLSVCLVILLGLGGFFITRYMGAGIDAKATAYYNDAAFKDYELISSLGITDDDLEQIKGTEGVTDAEGVIRADGALSKGDLKRNVEVVSMTERISVPLVTEGRAPAAKDECMIGEDFAEISGLKVGDKVRIKMADMSSTASLSSDSTETDEDADEEADGDEEAKEGEIKDALLCEEFTITALMKHPDYLRRKSTNVVALPWDAYDKEVTAGYYTHAFVKAEEPKGVGIFKDDYFKKTADQKRALEELADTLAVDSAERAKKKAYDYIDSEWEKALAELEAAQNDIDEGEAEMNSKLAQGRKKLNDAESTLKKKVAEYKRKLKNGDITVPEYNKTIKELKKELADAKAALKKAREMFENKIAWTEGLLTKVENLLASLPETGIPTTDLEKEIAQKLIDNESVMRSIVEYAGTADVQNAVKKLEDYTGKSILPYVQTIAQLNVDDIIDMCGDILDDSKPNAHFTSEILERVRDALRAIAEARKAFDDADKKIADAEKAIADGEKAAAKQIDREAAKAQKKIDAGWREYYSQKAKYESKLEEAKALLAENRELAEQKLAEAKAEVETIEGRWFVLDRRGNAGYVDMKSNLSAIESAGYAFGILFLLISSIVCFSTLAIIIEEQKKMVGTVKAFGFHKNEILSKYLLFGVTAAIIGSIAGILAALGLSGFVLQKYHDAGMYQFDLARSVITPGSTVIACIGMILVCALATVIASTDILKSPASILMKGGSTKKKGSNYRKTSSRRKGSLYSRLIIRNMLEDKTRVAISIAIIAFSTLLVGTGISMKLAFDGMIDKQVSEIYKYDIRVDLGDKTTDTQIAGLEKVLTGDGASYTQASYETHLYRWDDKLDALYVLTGDPDVLGEYFAIKDTKTGEALALPDDGVLVQKKMKESYKMTKGVEIPVLDSGLDMETAVVVGDFQNYVGRLIITSPEGYKATFGEDPDYNCFFVKTNGTDIEKIEKDLLAVSEDVSFEESKEFASKFDSVAFLYNIIIYVTVGIAIIMSFMILTNLANIFLNRKKTELTVMRINGFSIKQTKGYLARETVVTTTAGVLLGVLLGAIIAPLLIRMMEQPDLQFVRTFHVWAWVVAVALEVLFSVVINSLVFRKVKFLNFRDVA